MHAIVCTDGDFDIGCTVVSRASPLADCEVAVFLLYFCKLRLCLYNTIILLLWWCLSAKLYVYGKRGVDEELVRDLGGANARRTLLLFPSDEALTVEDVAATHQSFSDDADGPPLQIMVVDGSWGAA